jgi:glycine cleavage system aminomethyltransferase T
MEIQRQSALHPCHLQAQAHLESFSGWQLPAWYSEASRELEHARTAVGLSDASHLFKTDLRGPASEFPLSPPARLWKLTPSHSLVTSRLPIMLPSSPSVTDVTSIYSVILLAGPNARAVLQKLTTLNVREGAMPEGSARQTRLAHVNATILRTDSANIPGFLILNTRDVAEHVWNTLLHAGAEFNVQPFGVIAQQQWMGFRHDQA